MDAAHGRGIWHLCNGNKNLDEIPWISDLYVYVRTFEYMQLVLDENWIDWVFGHLYCNENLYHNYEAHRLPPLSKKRSWGKFG